MQIAIYRGPGLNLDDFFNRQFIRQCAAKIAGKLIEVAHSTIREGSFGTYELFSAVRLL